MSDRTTANARTLYDKIWDAHAVAEDEGDTVLYVDLHLVNEVTSPLAFAGLRASGRAVRRPDRTLAVADHNTPTERQVLGTSAIEDSQSRLQIETLTRNVAAANIPYFPMGHADNGIVHVVGPEQGRTHPGMVIVCGDSHTSTHGAFGALAFGIGTSEAEHVLATQTIRQRKARNMTVRFDGEAAPGIYSKDFALALIGAIGTAGGTGHVIEYTGPAIARLSMEARMSLCNMTIEAGARAGLIAPDSVTMAYLAARIAHDGPDWAERAAAWSNLATDAGAVPDKEVAVDVSALSPQVTWGTSPQDVVAIESDIPDPASMEESPRRHEIERSLHYMGLRGGAPIMGTPIDRVFIGSCTNSRIEDLRIAAEIVRGRRVKHGVRAMVVPGSNRVRRDAEAEGLDRLFRDSGFEWREPGCSMCLGMNPDRLAPGERCISTSNRNFEGRQGRGGRTHLASPAMAAAAAVAGCIADVRDLL